MSRQDEYVTKLKAQLDIWNADLKKLEARANNARADLTLKYNEQIRSIRQHRDELEAKLAEMQGSGHQAWDHLRDGAEKAQQALKEALQKAKSAFE